jgi:riboflavin kinase/FMN adenylyltransferase
VHILDFYGDLYGKSIKVIFYRRLREETKFNSASDLIEQISRDVERAREEWLKIKE